MEIAKVTNGGKVTLPISIREKLKLKAGDTVVFIKKIMSVLY